MKKRITRSGWQEHARFAQERADEYAAQAELLFDQAARSRTRKKTALLLRRAANFAARADTAHATYLFALEKIRESDRRRERYEQAQRVKRGRIKLFPEPPIIREEWEEFGDEAFVEWEFGFEYDAVSNNAGSNVDMNFRVRRVDGKPFSAREAARVMDFVRENSGKAPTGYKFRAVDWRSPNKKNPRWKSSGDVVNVIGNLGNVLDAVSKQPQSWRLGAPKDF